MSAPQTDRSVLATTSRSSAYSTDWQLLALDALSRLTRQFAQHPDFGKLIDLVLLTVTGQLSITGAFTCITDSLESEQTTVFKGSGKLHSAVDLQSVGNSTDQCDYLLDHRGPQRVVDLLDDPQVPPGQFASLAEFGVGAIVPLTVGDKLLGVLGVTHRVDQSPFSEDDLSLLGTLADTMAPLLNNSLLYARIESLNEWLRDILDSVRHGVLVFSADLVLKRINERGKRLLEELGVSSDWNNESLNVDGLFDEAGFPGWRDLIRNVLTDKQANRLENFIARGKSGERVFSLHVSQTAGEEIEHRDLILTIDDITAQQENEQRFFELEKFAEKGVMASSIAHELNNFLALILGGLELAELAMRRDNTDKVKTSLAKLKKNALTMERFTAGLTDYSHMKSQKQNADINVIVRDVVGFAKVQRRFKRLNLDINLGLDLPNIHADVDQIVQLLMNLLNNAADAIRESGKPDGRIMVTTSVESDRVVLNVTDSGIGIPDELKEKLFQVRFTTKEDGHGFGLVTCGRILEQHGASHTVTSVPGEGSTISVMLPAANELDS